MRILQFAPQNIKGDTQIEPEYITGDIEVKGDIAPAVSQEYIAMKKYIGGDYGTEVILDDDKKSTAGSAEHLQYLVGKMKQYLPEDKFDYNAKWFASNKFRWTFDGSEHVYNMEKKEDREKLLSDIDTRIGRMQVPYKTYQEESASSSSGSPMTEGKQAILDDIHKENVVSIDEYVRQKAMGNKQKEDSLRQQLEQYGITEKDVESLIGKPLADKSNKGILD